MNTKPSNSLSPETILFDDTINQGNLWNFLKTAIFGVVEVIILLLGYTSAQKYLGFQTQPDILYELLLWYLVIRCGLAFFSDNIFRIVVTEYELIYYYPKKKGKEQKVLTISRKNIVKITADFDLHQSIYITYMQESEQKKLQIYAHETDEVYKIRKLHMLLGNNL